MPGWVYGSTAYIKRQIPFGKTPSYVSVDGGADYGVTIGAFKVEAENGTVFARLHNSLQDKPGAPTAAVIPYGKGKLGVIGINIGTQYNDGVQYQHRELIRKMTANLYDPIARVESADGICEIVCLSVNGKLTVQVLNAGGSHRDMQLSTENYTPPLRNTVISLRSDIDIKSIVLQPENVPIETYKCGNRTCFKIPEIKIHSVVVIE